MIDPNHVICPGCTKKLPASNRGCTRCRWQDGTNNRGGRIQPLRDYLHQWFEGEGMGNIRFVCAPFLAILADLRAQGKRHEGTRELVSLLRHSHSCVVAAKDAVSPSSEAFDLISEYANSGDWDQVDVILRHTS